VGSGIEFDGVRLEMASKDTGAASASEPGAELAAPGHIAPQPARSFREAVKGPAGAGEFGAPERERLQSQTIDWQFDTESETERVADDASFTAEVAVSKETRWVKIRENFFSRVTTVVMIGSFAAIAVAGVYYLFWHPGGSFGPKAAKPVSSTVPAQTKSEQELRAKLEQQKREMEALKAKLEREKQAEQERLAQEEKAKQEAEQERLARIEQVKQAERERLARIERAKQAERERLARIEQAKQAESERLARMEQERLAQLKQTESDAIAKRMADAREAWQRQEYVKARKHFAEALQMVSASAFRAEMPFSTYKHDIEVALKDDDMVFGPQGYIKYRGKWLTPQDYETTRFQEGYVRYKGELIHYAKLSETIERITYPDVNAFLTKRYAGQRIHSKNIQLKDIDLKSSTNQASVYTVSYDWEAWTFNDLGKGRCILEISYNVEKDSWRIMKGCE
jgi:chemotaxis protein histidine kinase CheA